MTAPNSPAAKPGEGRFPNSGRRRVSSLSGAQTFFGPVLFLFYAAGALVAAPFVLRLNWYTNQMITDVAPYFCIAILSLPTIGFFAGINLLMRCAAVSRAAEAVDRRTQGLFDDHATLQTRARETLAADYDANAHTRVPIVDALRSDALRRAFVDRWEPSNWLVEAHWAQLSIGLPLIATLQRMALQLGILFTFVGLAVAFSSDAFQLSVGVNAIPDIRPLVTALQVKFMASIAGLVSSVSLLGLGWACRRELASAVARLEAMVDNILTLAKTMRSDPTFASDITQLRESVQRMDSRVDGLALGYNSVVKAVQDGIHSLATAKSEFEIKLEGMLVVEKRVASEIGEFYGRMSPQGLADHLGDVLNRNMDSFSQNLATTSESVGALNDAVTRLAAAERMRAQDDATADARHREVVNVLRSLRQKSAWGTANGGANK